jgi:PPE-repeat protein
MVIAANRSLLATLVATNILGQNTPAIAATEAHYAEMWAQDAAAMYGYASASASAAQVTPFATPPQTANPAGLNGTSGGIDTETLMSSGPQLISGMPQTLQSLASPQAVGSLASSTTDSTSSSSSSTSSLSMLNSLSTPLRMATMPMSMLSRLFTAGSTANAARAVNTAASELGAAQSAGLGSTTLLASTGAGMPAISAGMGQAASVGPLSVPSSWVGAAPSTSAAAMPFGATSAIPAAHPAAAGAIPPMMPITNVAGREGSAAPSRFEMRSTVVPFSPAGG